MADQLLSIPLKPTTSTDIDFSTNDSFIKYFTKSLGVKDKGKLIAICGGLTALRAQATSRSLEKTPTGLQIISRYADQIGALIATIPSTERDIVINFSWEDAFDKGSLFSSKSNTTQSLFTFEHVCILFNIGALQSHFGADQRFAETDEELKTAARWFQNAAGIFDHLSVHVQAVLPAQGCLTKDLQPETLNTLSSLMLAQAQEIIVKKAIRDKMKDGILAKVCTQTEEMFGETLTKMTNTAGKTNWDKAWLNNLTAKQLLYSGLAQFYQAKLSAANKNFGEQIARLALSVECLRKSQERLKLNTATQFLVDINKALTDAKKENDFIYHELIPDPKSLQPIEKGNAAKLVKATPMPGQFSTGFRDLFVDLEPHAQGKEEAPLKAALDATVHAAGYYMNKLLSSGKKSNK